MAVQLPLTILYLASMEWINNSALFGGAIMTNINNTLTFNGTVYFTNNGHYGRGVNSMNEYNFGGGVFMGLISTNSLSPFCLIQLFIGRTIMQL